MRVAHLALPVGVVMLLVLTYPPSDASFLRGLGAAFFAQMALQSLVVIWRDWRKA